MDDLERTEGVAVRERCVDGVRHVLRSVQPQPDLERPEPQLLPGQDRDRLRVPLAADDVGLPLVRVDGRAARAGERSEAAEVGAMAVRDDDPLQVGDAPAQAVDCPEHGPGVAVEEGVDERELTAVLEEEGPYVAALAAAEAVDGRGELGHVETIRRSRG